MSSQTKMNKLDITKVSVYLLVCNLQKPGPQIMIAGEQNVLRNLLIKSNDEVLTPS